MKTFKIANKKIGIKFKPFVIAEIGQNHDGSLGMAHSYIDAVAKTGADAIKFQTHIARAESSPDEKFRVPFSYVDKTRYDYWKRMEFTEEQWRNLSAHAKKRGMIFLSSPFSLEAAKLLEKIGCPAWKIGSGELKNIMLLSFIAKTKKPVLLSSGMSSYSELDEAVKTISKWGNPLALFQCTSKYPTSFREVGLNNLDYFMQKYDVPVGLSDHSGSIYPSLFSLSRGARLLEVHVTFHKSMFGPDIKSSLSLEELKLIVDGAKAFHSLDTNPVNKDKMARGLNEMKELFEKSLAVSKSLKKGTLIKKNMLIALKPGTGIPVKDLDKVIGKRTKMELERKTLLSWKDLE